MQRPIRTPVYSHVANEHMNNSYHHWSCEFEPLSWRSEHDTVWCDQDCQWLAICA